MCNLWHRDLNEKMLLSEKFQDHKCDNYNYLGRQLIIRLSLIFCWCLVQIATTPDGIQRQIVAKDKTRFAIAQGPTKSAYFNLLTFAISIQGNMSLNLDSMSHEHVEFNFQLEEF